MILRGRGFVKTVGYTFVSVGGAATGRSVVEVGAGEVPETMGPAWATSADLQAWLLVHRVPANKWAPPLNKDVKALFEEIQLGETVLGSDDKGEPLRITQVVRIRILSGNKVLREMSQEGRTKRTRGAAGKGILPSEKIKTWKAESWEEAALRCLAEELKVYNGAKVMMQTHRRHIDTENSSTSYPGLKSRYIVHTVTAAVSKESGLPLPEEKSTFSTREDDLISNWAWLENDPKEEVAEITTKTRQVHADVSLNKKDSSLYFQAWGPKAELLDAVKLAADQLATQAGLAERDLDWLKAFQ